MCKGNSGHCKGTVGEKKWSGGSGGTPPLFDNGHVTKEGFEDHREEFMGKSVEQIEKIFEQHGYKTNVRPSKREKEGSTAKIIDGTPEQYNTDGKETATLIFRRS